MFTCYSDSKIIFDDRFRFNFYIFQQVADTMLKAALYDEDENVRHTALMLYQTHPKSKKISPLNNRYYSYSKFDSNFQLDMKIV